MSVVLFEKRDHVAALTSEDAKFGLQGPNWGPFPLSGSTVRLPSQIPCAHVNRVAPKAHVLDAAREYATQIAGNGPVAVRAIR